MIRRTLREWQRIGYGDDDTTIPQAEADRIAAVATRSTFAGHGGEGVLEHGRKGLRARGVVGVIVAQGCQLEILPKIEGLGEREASDDALRRRLIHMLAVVHDLRIDAGSLAQLGWQKDTILELLIRLFCARLMEAVRMGLPRRYLDHADDLPALRGRLDVTRQFSRHAVAPQRLACRYDELSSDIPLNQVMRAAVTRLQHVAQAPDNQRILRELGFAYADVSDVSIPALRWDQITLDRTNQRWSELLSFARLLLTDRHQQTTAGAIDGHALLFEMNALFEQYVARLVTRALAGSGYRVAAQGGHRDCLFEGGTGRFRTKPDLIIRQGDRTVLVIDTKWKRMAPRIDDPKQGVSQADVYQLMAYSQLYRCPNVMLLYPHHGDLPPDPIRTRYAIASEGAEDSLLLATMDVTGSSHAHAEALKHLIQGVLREHELA
ncbi:restriction endonuclease [Phaeobacter gallaeciensis]|uniref:McrC family protein n=1 Tax=Phaeobacter gallaeciensis TaxID=60890 RepID=UPI00237FD2A7|nr:restriction endonuclease [Phaeobacter gallaeciensis]MDE4305860.1 restriction endonuclease [Phaeobacter gallaeciensis]MDE4310159.1 restriction endonuclease [Phaeobacter gallaeciensis]MDE4314671.1 restriction endonuclease [Phaeobacter gallaeciensis]MDE4319062.1 restriction endonuclease [Phaeobacter gallaeciensis]MDE4323610.1 restriction endonuclease [Phaeobacter gallaeciensis]